MVQVMHPLLHRKCQGPPSFSHTLLCAAVLTLIQQNSRHDCFVYVMTHVVYGVQELFENWYFCQEQKAVRIAAATTSTHQLLNLMRYMS